MAVDDTWFKKGPDGKKVHSEKHGRGKRWRVRYTDAAGKPRERMFELKRDAEIFDALARTGVEDAVRTDQARLTFREYAERWRLARETGWAEETRRRVESNLRLHLYPAFGGKAIRSLRPTDVLEWLTGMVRADTPKSTIELYFNVFRAVCNAGKADKVITDNPSDGIKLAQFLRGISRVPKWVPTAADVVRLIEVVPDRYKAMIWLGAGEALRIGEALGVELGPRCADFLRREFHVVQQLRHAPEHGGFYLCDPKSGSSGTVDLDTDVAVVLADHIKAYPPVEVKLVDMTAGQRRTRTAALLFTDERGRPITDQRWSDMWKVWRSAAGWPDDEGFHALRHFSATTMITAGVEPQAVQRHLRHASLKITLETYVGWWPKSDRPRGLIAATLRGVRKGQDQAQVGT